MHVGERALKELFPDKKARVSLTYSRAFNPYNANVRGNLRKIDFRFSHVWEEVSEDIQVGLAQHLLLKLFKAKKNTLNIELYEKFMEKLPRYVQNNAHNFDAELMESFRRINREYFDSFMEMPALEWGSHSTTQLGIYYYHQDTVRLSRIFQGLPEEKKWMLDYVMYHELLHKKFGLQRDGGTCRHHTREFREMEARFREKDAEKRLQRFVAGKRAWQPLKKKRLFMRNLFK